MQITHEMLCEIETSLRQQLAQGQAMFNEATGALQLVDHLKATLADALTEKKLGEMLGEADAHRNEQLQTS